MGTRLRPMQVPRECPQEVADAIKACMQVRNCAGIVLAQQSSLCVACVEGPPVIST